MKINGLQAEIENEGEFVILKLKMHPADFVKFVTDCGKLKKEKVKTGSISIESKVKDLHEKVANYRAANPGKHPNGLYNEFMKYWVEPDKQSKKIRYDGEKFFDIGKRLATFKSFVKPEQLSKMWEEDQKNNKIPTLL